MPNPSLHPTSYGQLPPKAAEFNRWTSKRLGRMPSATLTSPQSATRGAPTLRGPGAAGLAYATSIARRSFIYLQQHTGQSIVEKVDHGTALGYGTGPGDREAPGLPGGGPALAESPLAIMHFCETTKRMRLRSVHPGHTVDEVMENSGAQIILPEHVPETDFPTPEEPRILRTQVDAHDALRNLKGARGRGGKARAQLNTSNSAATAS